jgi:hypothetical protein
LDEKPRGIRQELAKVEARLGKSSHEPAETSKAQTAKRYADEIEKFLMLESIINADMRKIINYISVSRDGKVEILLRDIRDFS